jgi:PAS domain S-box-containing protein
MAHRNLHEQETHHPVGVRMSTSGRTLRRLRRASLYPGLTAAIAGLVLLGWTFDLALLKSVVPGLVPMNPVTAVTFLLAALSLWCCSAKSCTGNVRQRWLGRACALAVVAVGTARLWTVLSGSEEGGIDQWLFASKLGAGFTMPNRMSPTAAFNFFLVGCALLFLHARRRRLNVWGCIFALVAGFESLVAILGYAYEVSSLYGVGSFLPMALHTAVCFLILTYGIMACQSDRGFLALITGRNAGGVMARRLLPATILVPAALGWLRLEGQRLGWYSPDAGVAFYTVTYMAAFGGLVCCNALSLFRTDAGRTKLERRMRRAHADLEARGRALHAETERLTAEIAERERLEQLQARFAAIVESSDDAIMSKTIEGIVTSWNRAAEKIFGYTAQEAVGQPMAMIIPPERAEEELQILARLAKGESIAHFQTVRVRKDGKRIHVSATISPIKDRDGKIIGASKIARDITAQKAADDALLESRRQLEAVVHANQLIMDNSRDVICTIDAAGCFVTMSGACESLWGYTPAELIGRPYIDMVYGEDLLMTNEAAVSVMAGSEVRDFENRYVRKDGAIVNVMWSAYWSDADKIMFCVAHDITERTRAGLALKQAEDAANRANRAKSEFLSRMSHELRTPMNAILGFAQLLALDDLTDEQREGLGHIASGGEHLLKLINEVLDISQIEAGRMSLSCEPVEVAEALRESIALLQPVAAEREVRLHAAPIGATFVLADRQRLKQVLINLISNAIKYNRVAGSVSLRCETGGDRARISIVDTGIGIREEHLERLFAPFERLGAEQSETEGTGLGLTVTKRLVEAMNGTMGVESRVGRGSTFWVEFPLTQSPLARLELSARPSELAPATRVQHRIVLYIEDNSSNLKVIERLFRLRPGLKLIAARDGQSGLQVAREQQPDLILLDLNLPDMDGRDVLARLLAEPHTEHIPVIALSADASPGQIDRIIRAGATEYVTKPLNVVGFLKVLDRTLSAPPPPSARKGLATPLPI